MDVLETLRYRKYRKRYDIADSFKFGHDVVLMGDGNITIGEEGYANAGVCLKAVADTSITVGKHCVFAYNAYASTAMVDSNQDLDRHPINRKNRLGNITFEDGCFIGYSAFISPGITIGKNAIVGANSVVTHDVPAYTIVGGCPARKIKRMTWMDQ